MDGEHSKYRILVDEGVDVCSDTVPTEAAITDGLLDPADAPNGVYEVEVPCTLVFSVTHLDEAQERLSKIAYGFKLDLPETAGMKLWLQGLQGDDDIPVELL